MADIQLNLKDSSGNPIAAKDVIFNLGQYGIISRKTDENGKVTVTGLYNGKYSYKIDTPIAVFNSTKYGEIAKIGNSDGIIKLQGIIDNTKIKIIKDGYEDKTIELSIPSTNSYIEKIVIM